MGKHEVTFAEWDACVSDGGCGYRPDDSNWGRSQRPVIKVSWEDISNQFIPWINRKTGKRYRLPSEAEWEYATRAGASSAYWWGSSITCSQAAYGSCGKSSTVPVGQYQANSFGLYDVHGNVWEWAQDCWHDSYAGAPADGSAWVSGGNCGSRVLRGGFWFNDPAGLRSAGRNRNNPSNRNTNNGFRLAQSALFPEWQKPKGLASVEKGVHEPLPGSPREGGANSIARDRGAGSTCCQRTQPERLFSYSRNNKPSTAS